MTTQPARNAARESLLWLAIVAAILVALNALGVLVSGRLDLTERKLFSLSDGSKRVADRLTDRMEVTAYFTADLPPPFNATERYVRDILTEYEKVSADKIRVAFIDPVTEAEREQADTDGVQKVAHQVVENDSVSVREGYRGLVIKYLGDKKTIPVIEDTSGLEYRITQAMKQLVGDARKVAILKGAGGPSLTEGLSKLSKLQPTYSFEEVDGHGGIDDKFAALMIVGAEQAIPEHTLRSIDAFLMKGKSVGIFGGTVATSFEGQEPSAKVVETGLNKLLKPYDVAMESQLVLDWQCGRAPMLGPLGITVAVPYPPIPTASIEQSQQEHPALYKLSTASLPFTAPLQVGTKFSEEGETSLRILASSSTSSWALDEAPFSLRIKRPDEWKQTRLGGPFPLMVAVEGKLPSAFAAPVSDPSADDAAAGAAPVTESAPGARLLVVGSSTFLRDELLPEANQRQNREMSGATALAMNVIDWLAQDADLIAIRAKSVEDPALAVPASVKQAEEAAVAAAEMGDQAQAEGEMAKRQEALSSWETRKAAYRWFNMLGLPLLFGLYGLLRLRRRRSRAKELARPVGA